MEVFAFSECFLFSIKMIISELETSERSNRWRKLGLAGSYNGSVLARYNTPSRIQCASRCMTTFSCQIIGHHKQFKTCLLISGPLSAAQVDSDVEDSTGFWEKN